MFALFTTHGTNDETDYLTVAIQDKGIKSGGRLIASKVFFREKYSTPEPMMQDAMDWASGFKIDSVQMTKDMCQPSFCETDGSPHIRVLD